MIIAAIYSRVEDAVQIKVGLNENVLLMLVTVFLILKAGRSELSSLAFILSTFALYTLAASEKNKTQQISVIITVTMIKSVLSCDARKYCERFVSKNKA